MARFDDLDRYFDPGLTLTVRGKEYVLPLPPAELGLWCRRVAEAAGAVNAASTPQELEAAVGRVHALPDLPGDLTLPERTLGDAYRQMVADGVPDPYITFCGNTAYVWIIGGEQAAEAYWTSGGRPEALGPGNRASRRAAERTGGTSTAVASGTRPPASTSGTNTRQRSRSRGRGHRSPGRSS
jgi:hypothetical protein